MTDKFTWTDDDIRMLGPEEKSGGDKPGHQFRGNQWTKNISSASSEEGYKRMLDQQPQNFADLQATKKAFTEMALAQADDLNGTEIATLQDYCDMGYTEINADLRSHEEHSIIGSKVEAMDAAFKSIPAFGEPTVLYRSTKLPQELKPGTVFHDDGFVSTSFRAETTHGFFGDTIAVIHATPKTKILFGSVREYEGILPRGTRFRVADVGEIDTSKYVNMDLQLPGAKFPKMRRVTLEVLDD